MREILEDESMQPLVYDPAVDGVTQSVILKWRSCEVKARMSLKGYTSEVPSTTTFFGSLFHSAMEYLLGQIKLGKHEITEQDILLGVKFAQEKERQSYEDSATPGKEAFMEGLALLTPALEYYFKHWHEDFTSRKKTYLAVEESFRVNIPGTTTGLRGKRDGVYVGHDGNMWLLEHKTKSQISEDSITQTIGRDFQNLLYIYTYYLETGRKLSGVLYDVIRKTSLKKKVNETLGQYALRIGEDTASRPEFYFMRFEAAIPWSRVEKFAEALSREAAKFTAWWEQDEDLDLENTSSCWAFNSACPYMGYCDSGRCNLGGLSVKKELFGETK